MQTLFQYAIILQAKTGKDGEEVEKATLLVEPTTVLCSSLEQAQMLAAREIAEDKLGELDRITVVVRPF